MRNGKYGYSDRLGRFCGPDFPPIVASTDRFLWLRFHSDENIEYDGFQAVYEYMPKDPKCMLNRNEVSISQIFSIYFYLPEDFSFVAFIYFIKLSTSKIFLKSPFSISFFFPRVHRSPRPIIFEWHWRLRPFSCAGGPHLLHGEEWHRGKYNTRRN